MRRARPCARRPNKRGDRCRRSRTAIAQYVSDRPRRLLSAIERVRTEDQELLERLSQ